MPPPAIPGEPPREKDDIASDVLPLVVTQPPIPRTAASLCNFPTGKAILRHAHKAWLTRALDENFLPPHGCWMDIIGYASRLGKPGLNQALSRQRCEAVEHFLRERAESFGHQLEVNIRDGKGEDEAERHGFSDGDNNGLWRMVRVFVYGGKKQEVPVPPATFGETDWTIRVVFGLQAGAAQIVGLKGDLYLFEVESKLFGKDAYLFWGGGPVLKIPGILSVGLGIKKGHLNWKELVKALEKGAAVGVVGASLPLEIIRAIVKPGPAGGIIGPGVPQPFTTSRPVTPSHFEGRASVILVKGAITTKGHESKITMHFESRALLDPPTLTRPTRITMQGGAGILVLHSGSAEGHLSKVHIV